MLYLQILTKEQIVEVHKIRVVSDNSPRVLLVAVMDTIEDSNCSNTIIIMQEIRQCVPV